MRDDAPLRDNHLPLGEQHDDPAVASVLGRATMAVGVVVIIGAIALSVWAAGG